MYERVKNDILGKKYSLSLAFIDEKKSRELNKKYRGKDRATNVLAFPLSKTEGEILLCRKVAQREAKNFDKTTEQFLFFLVIHAMLHLKGMRHGSIMERQEEFFLEKHDQKYFRGNRRRLHHDESRGGRIFKRRKKS